LLYIFQVFETNRAVSLAKAVFERKDEDQQQQQQQLEEARKKYERDILSRPSVFSKLNERIKSLDLPEESAAPVPTPTPVIEESIRAEKVVPLCSGGDDSSAAPSPAPVATPDPIVSRASGKFGVTLRRTSSKLSDVAAPKEDALDATKPQVVAPSAPPASEMPAEEVVNVKQLELMVRDFLFVRIIDRFYFLIG
jgi:hypothetical protein